MSSYVEPKIMHHHKNRIFLPIRTESRLMMIGNKFLLTIIKQPQL